MYKLNYLSICLILIAFFVFYNEFNKQLNISEMALLAISFIAILRASYNYIQLDNTNKLYEGFSIKSRKNKKKNHNGSDNELNLFNDNYKYSKNRYNDNDNDIDIFMNSEESNTYLDIEKEDRNPNMYNSFEKITNVNTNSKLVNDNAINSINNLLGINKSESKDFFHDIPDENDDDDDNNNNNNNDEIKSVFMPKIVIGKNSDNDNDNDKNCRNDRNGNDNQNYNKWNSVFRGNEFDVKNANITNMESNMETSNQESTTYNQSYKSYTDKKKCSKYNSRDSDLVNVLDDGNFLIKEYKQSKTWHPGYTYLPPSNWDVPQQYPPVCLSNPNVFKLTGLMDRGLPINALELNPNGLVADTENSVQLTNVGSMLPKFKFEEMPFSKPYV